MAKRSYSKSDSKLKVKVEDDSYLEDDFYLEDDEVEEVSPYGTTRLMLVKELTLKIVGKVSGNQYVFHGAGSQVNVLNEDVEGMIHKISTVESCCGDKPQPYFQIVK